VCEAALGLQALHDGGVLYRDLKVSNALVDAEGHIRLADFGLAKRAVSSGSFLGSVGYLAPEMLEEGREHGQALDWYLLGVFAYEMMHGMPPFYCEEREEMERRVREEQPAISEKLSN
jgi:serine/threonine protein kinase